MADFATEGLRRAVNNVIAFTAGESLPNTGAGTRREGQAFECWGRDVWDELRLHWVSSGVRAKYVAWPGRKRSWARLARGGRAIYLPSGPLDLVHTTQGKEQLSRRIYQDSIVQNAIKDGIVCGEARTLTNALTHAGRYTELDDLIVLENEGALVDRIFVEYKSAKRNGSRNAVDGNAHERLSFQMMQCLEVALTGEPCALVVLCNGVFVDYANKYHSSFRIQAGRLRRFAGFRMQHVCSEDEYADLLERLDGWLVRGDDGPVVP